MSVELATLVMFGLMLTMLALGLPLAFSLGGTAVILGVLIYGTNAPVIFVGTMQTTMTSFVMVALPGFVFMAMVLEKSGIGDDLYRMMHVWLGPLKGGLAMGTVTICTIFAAMCGNSGAATVSMGVVALPSMLKRGYDKRLAMGAVSAGGALGILIPPSVIFIIYGEIVGVSVGKLFMAGLLPGFLLSIMFLVYIVVRSQLQPKLGPALPAEDRGSWKERIVSLRAIFLPILLVIFVLGSIFAGIATPTEAAGIGAAGSLLCAAINRRLNWQLIRGTTLTTLSLCAMVMWIIFGAKCFTHVYVGLGASELVRMSILGLPIGTWGILIAMQLTFFILGMFLDPGGIILLCAPIYVPIAVALGFDPVWYGVLFVMNMEMAYLTPPFGFNLFYMKAVAPPGTRMADIYLAMAPFIALQAVGLAIVMIYPRIALWLPSIMISQ